MKISSILSDFLARHAGHADISAAAWADDPYAHPEISAMSERERADLPPTHLPVPPAAAQACAPASRRPATPVAHEPHRLTANSFA